MEEEVTDDQGGEGYEEETPIPKIIPEEYLQEVLVKSIETVEKLKADGQFLLAEDIEKLSIISRNLRDEVVIEQAQNELMKSEVTDAQGRVAESIRISANDNDVMERMRKDIAEAWRQRDAAQAREQTAQETMYHMRDKLDVFQKEKDKYAGSGDAEQPGLGISKSKENVFHERDKLKSEVGKNEKKIEALQVQIAALEKQLQEKDNKINKFYEMMDESSTETTKDKRLIASLQVSVEEANREREKFMTDYDLLKSERDAKQKTIAQQNMQIMRVRTLFENATMKLNAATVKIAKITLENEQATMQLELTVNELNTKTNILKLKEDEANRYRQDNAKLTKMRDICLKRLMGVETAKNMLDQEVLKYKNVILTFEKERDANTKAFERARKQIEAIQRERDLVRKDLLRANKTIAEHLEHVILLEKHKKQLEAEIKGHLSMQLRMKQAMGKIEKERDKMSDENKALTDRVEDLQEDIFQKNNYITEMKDNFAETQQKLFQVQQQFEIVRTERNLYERDLQACTEVREDLRERLRIAVHQVDQLKEVISAKETELSKAQKHIEQLERDKQSLKKDLQNAQLNLQHAKSEIQELKMDAGLLRKIILENEAEIKKLQNNLRNINNEKDYISQQLTMRNSEIVLLKEKIALLQITLDRGDAQYNQRLEDIRLLKMEIANLRSQRNLLTRGLSATADMRQEVLQLNRVLTMERVKNKALEDEMSTPMNVHRWRKLGGDDPEKNNLLQKCQALQRRIISQSASGEKREYALTEIQKLYITLAENYSKLETISDPEAVNKKQRALTMQTKKMKSLMAELNCKDLEVKSKNCALEEMEKNLLLTRKELLKEKREKQKIIEFETNLQKEEERAQQVQSSNNPGYRTIGAGFKMPA